MSSQRSKGRSPARPAYFVGPWDLNSELACVPEDPAAGTVVIVESRAKGSALPFHKKKLVLLLSALRHFAQELEDQGYDVDRRTAASYVAGIQEHLAERNSSGIHALRPREWSLDRALTQDQFEVPLTIHEDGGEGGHFLLTREEFLTWAGTQKSKQLRMDVFYRFMRKKLGLLLEPGGKKPLGGKWSYDADNRKPLPQDLESPQVLSFAPDEITQGVMGWVAKWPGHWGEVTGFDYPVTREQALEELEDFVSHRLPLFGDYQDAMRRGDPFLWHSRIGAAMNLSLLHPLEVARAVCDAYEAGAVPLNCAEGHLRQVIGWREFIRGVYWLRMPDMRSANLLGAKRKLPAFYWDPSQTDMVCLQDSVEAVLEHGYAHHIQRLMVLGNFGLLAGIEPLELSHWFWAGFVDAYEWVELPNVHGMALYADDTFTTKPYSASGAYINRMSNYCKQCPYDVKQKVGEKSCPFNSLFWRFMDEHRERLTQNPRLGVLYKSWDKMRPAGRQEVLDRAHGFLDSLEPADHGWSFHDDQC